MPDVGFGLIQLEPRRFSFLSGVFTMPFPDFRLEDVTFRLMDFATSTSWLFPEQKRPVHPGNRNRHQFNRQEHATHDGIRGWRGEDEMHTKKFGSLTWRRFPRREQQRQHQNYDHAV